jgi:ArsR family transcriptional regulator, arsenate/arsenite/antimonite-responsive transcriptional repressor
MDMTTTSASPTMSELEPIAQLFHALADGTRLQIVRMLAGEELCVCDLQDAVGAYQSRLSFHLRRLKDAGLVADRKVGRWVFYSLRPEALVVMRTFLQTVEEQVSSRPVPAGGCCG